MGPASLYRDFEERTGDEDEPEKRVDDEESHVLESDPLPTTERTEALECKRYGRTREIHSVHGG